MCINPIKAEEGVRRGSLTSPPFPGFSQHFNFLVYVISTVKPRNFHAIKYIHHCVNSSLYQEKKIHFFLSKVNLTKQNQIFPKLCFG